MVLLVTWIDGEAVELTFFAIDHDPARNPLIPSQGPLCRDEAKPRHKATTGARSGSLKSKIYLPH
jgi:hypothetical protein